MRNPAKMLMLGLACTSALGAMSVWRPPEAAAVPDDAPLLRPLYAQPVEQVETMVLRRGETLSGVLAAARIGGNELSGLLMALREQKNPRGLREGSEITVRRWTADGEPRAVEVRVNADSTVRLDRGPFGWSGHVRVTPTVVDTLFIAGVIEQGRTLIHAMAADESLGVPAQERVQLAVDLAERVYGYKLDFAHDIQPGDSYRVVYEREARPDGSARSRRVLVAEIHNRGKLFSAVYFDAYGDGGGYYDYDGTSLRRGLRRYPMDVRRITSNFNRNRFHPILERNRPHLGVDFGAAPGTRVQTTGDGTIAFAGRQGGYGNLVIVRHQGGYSTYYAHLQGFAPGIRAGRRVQEGDVIGYVGSTGLATGPHLHYELRRNGVAMNPRDANLPGAPPIPAGQRSAFRRVLEQRVALMDRVLVPGPQLADGGLELLEAALRTE
jgi:murein DD-endopeptidase MepM/ murein hydrolase activator NlpD